MFRKIQPANIGFKGRVFEAFCWF